MTRLIAFLLAVLALAPAANAQRAAAVAQSQVDQHRIDHPPVESDLRVRRALQHHPGGGRDQRQRCAPHGNVRPHAVSFVRDCTATHRGMRARVAEVEVMAFMG